ncbi:hypothetical protein KXP75_000949 [Staphylococcus pseudintermedius]|uniref:hypothetical protein n=1 Tax=Staphylococcus pseudintermedius TaxID=283734 RepID=UPI001DA3A832|nr:hypothetical protein [Staphylococcus pseudintermedius]EHT8056363.1 hypothetical protein [Staphylococcus pseudintermedius]EIT0971757.1 hypothetical protein [Staphylococcus pseudintermedius]EJD8533404.1 hypothetical protein [Staphylococcus pseudintermedius]EKH2203500.1 hypothetical protein [Staphylococcus pseudintermedius]MDT0973760.1 hypothetical protein [Staphylococcus pseudintermedius]
MKSNETLAAERYLYDLLLRDKLSIYGCHEVTVGIEPLRKGREIVDFLTYDNKNVFRAYEIKVTKQDLKSSAKLSFVGHYNYLVMTEDLYEEVKNTNLIPFNIGIVIVGKGVIKKSGRKTLSMSDLIVKFLHWVSRDCCKNTNSGLRLKLQKGFNSWVGIPFKTSDFYDFYDNFGNGINHDFAVGTANSMV